MNAVSQHIVQRGRVDCFSSVEDILVFVDQLTVLAAHFECAVHAYALMANHVHLLLTSSLRHGGVELARALSNLEPELRPIHARRYLLACMRYIELNPVRAHIVAGPESYRWSSYRANALGYIDRIVTPHPLYYALGRSPETRRAAYARFVRSGFPRPDSVSP